MVFVLLAAAQAAAPATAAGTRVAPGKEEPKPQTGLLRLPAEGRPKRDCWVYVPKSYDKAKRYALVVVLHPAGVRGERFALQWGEVADRTGEFIVMAPECKDQTKRLWEIGDESLLIATVKKMIETYSIDSTRVLLTGFSQGGVYTYTFGLRNPSVFSAIAPVCGALVARPSTEGERILEQACGVPVYIVHGALDDRIPVERARASRDRLEKAGYRVVYRELPQLGHTNPAEESDRIWAWFKGITGQPAAGTK